MKRVALIAVAAIGLIGWVDPKTAGPTASKDAVTAEAQRQATYVFNARWKEIQRVNDIAFRLEAANQDLCPERRARAGFTWATADSFKGQFREAAVQALRLGPDLSVTQVVRSGPAAAAGLQVGDVLLQVDGEAPPQGADAPAKFARRLSQILEKAPIEPLVLSIRRDGQTQSLSITPVMACAYDVVVDDGADINAYADGKTVHILRPIMRLADTDEELALVIAHELAHNGQHHIQAQRHNATMAGLGGLLLDGVAAAGGVNTQGAFTKAAMQAGANHASPAFEAEADYVGMYYMARAGYSTVGVEDFWRKMAVEAPQSIFMKSDHPATPDRFLAIAAATSEIEAKRTQGQPLAPNQKDK